VIVDRVRDCYPDFVKANQPEATKGLTTFLLGYVEVTALP